MRFDSFTVVTLVRPEGYTELPAEEAARVQDGHLANIADLHDRGLLIAAGPSPGGDERIRGFGIMLCDVATARELWASDPGVLAARFEAVCEPWLVPAEMIIDGPGQPPRSSAEARG